MDPIWHIDLLGGLRVWRDSLPDLQFRTHKGGLLLAYLALHRRPIPRDMLAELLWPGSTAAAGRRNLRVELAALRSQLERPPVLAGSILVARRASVQLDPRAVDTDVARFEAALQEAACSTEPARRIQVLSRACAQYGGELLPGRYDEWILLARESLADRYRSALEELCRLFHQAGELERAIEVAHRLVAADPLNETAHFALIRLYAATQRPHDAQRQYRELEQRLQSELGLAPSATVRQFVTALASDREPTGPLLGLNDADSAAGSHGSTGRTQPLGSLPQSQLPQSPTRFFGRRAEIARVCRLLGGIHHGDTETQRAAQLDEEEAMPLARPLSPSDGTPSVLSVSPCLRGESAPQSGLPPRLVTLTGPGGSGKTRLAIEAARQLAPTFRGAVWFVSLADLQDPAAIPAAVAEALRLPRSTELDPLEQAAAVLSRQPSLLLLDNLEHLLDGGRELVQQLLRRVPSLTCLVTSRHRLAQEGEQELPVGPLPVPGDFGFWILDFGLGPTKTFDGLNSSTAAHPNLASHQPEPLSAIQNPKSKIQNLEALAGCPSVQLFVDRARAARAGFELTERNAGSVAAICARLEGVPLAIELAAAWASSLTPAEIASHLERGFSLLVSRRHDSVPRHQSLQAAIDWSYRLLEPALQRFLAQLTVFQGGWDTDAAQRVCDQPEALALIATLRDRSLVAAEESGERMRFRMLESLREYARAQPSDEEWRELCGRHTRYYRALAEEAEPHLERSEQKRWAERLQADAANLEAALVYGEPSEEGLRLAAALCRFWQLRAQAREGGVWLARLLAADPGVPAGIRARAVFGAAALAYRSGEPARGEALCDEGLRLLDRLPNDDLRVNAIRPLVSPNLLWYACEAPDRGPRLWEALARNQNDRRTEAVLRGLEGMRAQYRCDYPAASVLFEQSLARYRELGDQQGIAEIANLQGMQALGLGQFAAARRHGEEARALFQDLGDPYGVLRATDTLAHAALWQADYPNARRWMEETLALSRQIGSVPKVAGAQWLLGRLACSQGQYDRAAALLEESMTVRRSLGRTWAIADSFSALGVLAHVRGEYARARALQEEALRLRRAREDRLDIADSLSRLGGVALAEGQLAEAAQLCAESLALSREIGSERGAAPALLRLGLVACRQGDLAPAEAHVRESLDLSRRMGDCHLLAEGLEALAELRVRQRREEEAVTLYSAGDALRETIGAPLPLGDQPRQTRTLAALRAALGPERFAAAWEAARASDTDALTARGSEG